ncbi:unnamed protein product, partial [Chrysoparadoxa australica]
PQEGDDSSGNGVTTQRASTTAASGADTKESSVPEENVWLLCNVDKSLLFSRFKKASQAGTTDTHPDNGSTSAEKGPVLPSGVASNRSPGGKDAPLAGSGSGSSSRLRPLSQGSASAGQASAAGLGHGQDPSCVWIGKSSYDKKVSFKAFPSCHDFHGGKAPRLSRRKEHNGASRSDSPQSGCERAGAAASSSEPSKWIVVGFQSGECAVVNVFEGDQVIQSVHNEGHAVCPGGVSAIRFVPHSKGKMFVAAFTTGDIFTFDTGYAEVQPLELPVQQFLRKNSSRRGSGLSTTGGSQHQQPKRRRYCVFQRNEKGVNPVSRWSLDSDNCIVTDMAFSPGRNHRLLACTARDGALRVLDVGAEDGQLVTGFKSWFGALLCLAWSPDGSFIATGGEDDSVCLWCVQTGQAVMRGNGHSSWVTGVAFDAWNRPSDSYRFTSVAEDGKLCMWEYDQCALNLVHGHRVRRMSSKAPEVVKGASPFQFQTPNESKEGKEGEGDAIWPSLCSYKVPVAEPLCCKHLGMVPLCAVAVVRCGIVTLSEEGTIKLWSRPKVPPALALRGLEYLGLPNEVNSPLTTPQSQQKPGDGSAAGAGPPLTVRVGSISDLLRDEPTPPPIPNTARRRSSSGFLSRRRFFGTGSRDTNSASVANPHPVAAAAGLIPRAASASHMPQSAPY